MMMMMVLMRSWIDALGRARVTPVIWGRRHYDHVVGGQHVATVTRHAQVEWHGYLSSSGGRVPMMILMVLTMPVASSQSVAMMGTASQVIWRVGTSTVASSW